MNIIKKISYFLITVIFIAIGCGPTIPKSQYPLEIEKKFHASFDKTWDAVLEVAKMSNGVIITNDKSSGLITYRIADKKSQSKIYMNVYLKTNTNANVTTVIVFSKNRTGNYLGEIERDLFENLKTILGG